jgi:hypothetical protein
LWTGAGWNESRAQVIQQFLSFLRQGLPADAALAGTWGSSLATGNSIFDLFVIVRKKVCATDRKKG